MFKLILNTLKYLKHDTLFLLKMSFTISVSVVLIVAINCRFSVPYLCFPAIKIIDHLSAYDSCCFLLYCFLKCSKGLLISQ